MNDYLLGFTGTSAEGRNDGDTCSNWTNGSLLSKGRVGITTHSGLTWTWSFDFGVPCGGTYQGFELLFHLYCFED